ncbi:MAG: hypothetical protein ACM30I_14450 [Gemmatimonas sp.]
MSLSEERLRAQSPVPLGPQVSPDKENFFVRYWNGQVSLPISYWVVSFLVNLVFAALSVVAAEWGATHKEYVPLQAWGLISGYWCLAFVIWCWQLVGLWRSAGHYIEEKRGPRIWGWLARLVTLGAAIRFLNLYVSTSIPQMTELSRMAFLGDPDIPAFRLEVAERDSEIRVIGGIKYGLDAELKDALLRHRSITTISFDSIGGRIGEAEKLFHTISVAGVNTVVNARCASACTIAFAGGRQRWIGSSGRLGFHSGSFVGQTREQNIAATQRILDDVAKVKGIDRAFLRKGFSIDPKTIWVPTRDELLGARFITSRHSEALSSLREIEAGLKEAAKKVTLPSRLDQVTELVEVEVELNKWTNVYDLSLTTQPSPSDWTRLRSRIANAVCGNKDMKSDMERGVIYAYRYRDARSHAILSVFEFNGC